MRVSCPSCGAELTLDVLIAHEGARRAVAAAMQVSAPLAHRLMHYIALFRPAQRQLTMERVASLLEELLPAITAQRVERNGTRYDTTTDDWKAALDQVLANRDAGLIKLPLKSHGYLIAVLAEQREKWLRSEENRREAERRNPHRNLSERSQAIDAIVERTAATAARIESVKAAVDALPAAPGGPRQVPADAPLPECFGPRQVPAHVAEHLQRLGVRQRPRPDTDAEVLT